MTPKNNTPTQKRGYASPFVTVVRLQPRLSLLTASPYLGIEQWQIDEEVILEDA